MITSSAARAAASRANAKRSTGPKTAAGKARSCKNATKHGLSGQGVGLLPEDQAMVEHRIACWSEELGAVGDLESELVATAASASVRRRRAEITEAGRATERMAKARARRLRRAESRLAEAEATLAAWDGAIAGYRAAGVLSYRARVALGGLVGEDADRPGPVLSQLIALQERIARWASDADKAEARGKLWAELHRHRVSALAVVEERREAVEAAAASEPADGWLDRTKAGELLRRYHGAAERSFYRALAELNRSRRLPDSPVEDGPPNEARSDDGKRNCAAPEGSVGHAIACRPAAVEGIEAVAAAVVLDRHAIACPTASCDEPVAGIQPPPPRLLPRGGRRQEGLATPAPIEARTADGPETSVHPSGPTLREQRRAIGEALQAFLGPLVGLDLEGGAGEP